MPYIVATKITTRKYGVRTEWQHTVSVCRHSVRPLHCMATRDPITNIMTIFEPEILGDHNINTGTALLLKTIAN